jgi:hypothetical protein
MKLNKEQILALIRQILTTVGVILVSNGVLSEGIVLEITGSVITLLSVFWSVFDKSETQLQKKMVEFLEKNQKKLD